MKNTERMIEIGKNDIEVQDSTEDDDSIGVEINLQISQSDCYQDQPRFCTDTTAEKHW